MTKKEIVDRVSVATGLQKKEVLVAFQRIIEAITDSLSEQENVYIRGFGTFKIVDCAEKKARDIRKHKTVIVPKHKVVKFQPSNFLSARVKD